jgi:hypothetical protein
MYRRRVATPQKQQKPPGTKLADHVSWPAAGRSIIVIVEERE